MHGIRHILIALGAGLLSLGWVVDADAKPLTHAEQLACPDLRSCVDIIRRHDAWEFDYEVLESEFRRLGVKGRKALFDVLDSKAGNPDIARMILALGPLTDAERLRVDRSWSIKSAGRYLPLLLDGHAMSRDKLLLSLGHENAAVRETARRGLLRLSPPVRNAPISSKLTGPLLEALAIDPIPAAAPYVARLPVDGKQKAFSALFLSGEVDLVAAAYKALYRDSPAQAFNLLLAEMGGLRTPHQARAIGDILKRRDANKPDGFYQKFAVDMSTDEKFPVAARAAALHAVLMSQGRPFPALTAERKEALSFLVSGNSAFVERSYLDYLAKQNAMESLELIWRIAQQERWPNRDRIAAAFQNEPMKSDVTRDLIMSYDLRSVRAGLARATPLHAKDIQAQIEHPVMVISNLARAALGLHKETKTRAGDACEITAFDLVDMTQQVPFFDDPWLRSEEGGRYIASRDMISTAHPTSDGWLVGYNTEKSRSRLVQNGGGLVRFDNRTGDFQVINGFNAPIAILPDRKLELGASTTRFWVVDRWRTGETSLYMIDLSKPEIEIQHLGAPPDGVKTLAVTKTGDLTMTFIDAAKGVQQAPIKVSLSGRYSAGCGPSMSAEQTSVN